MPDEEPTIAVGFDFSLKRYDDAVHVLAYWLARLALVFTVFVALWGLGWTPWFAVLAAAAIAMFISYALFGSTHDAAARQMEQWVSRRFVRVAGDEVAEDGRGKVETVPTQGVAPKAVAPDQPRATAPTKPRATAAAKPGATAPAKPRATAPAKPKGASPAVPEPGPKAAALRSS